MKRESHYACQVCGTEADLIIEGFDTVKDVMKLGTMVCEKCGTKEEIALSNEAGGATRAVSLALERERDAYLFYKKAAHKTSSERGKDMFNQLAAFELNHYKKMVYLAHSLQKRGRWVPYSGEEDLKPNRRIEELQGQRHTMTDDIGALTLAIKKEEEAEALYRELAEGIEDATGKGMFKTLAGEEEVHRRLLNDQLYSLSNRGLWVWGE
jgi:rubrerythrin